MESNPTLRDSIDVQLIQDQAERVIYISCRIGVSQPLALIAPVGPILMMLDGTRPLATIKNHFAQQGVNEDIIDRVLQVLDTNYYLNNSRFLNKQQEVADQFRNSNIRPAAHAGRIYPNDKSELNNYLENLLETSSGAAVKNDTRKLAAIVAPHIDYRRGSSGYVKAYQQLTIQKPDICIIIGTSHQAGHSLFQMCNKDFECPNGTLKVQNDFVSHLISGYGKERALADELLHRQEHSLELQIPFLNYFCPNTQIVPILVGNFYPFLRNNDGLSSVNEYNDFIATLSQTTKIFSEQGSKVTFIAGVDMAHVGQNFGDQFLLDQQKLNYIELQDRIYLESICSLSSSKMFAHIAKDRDARRICGFPTMHTVLDVLNKMNKSYEVDLIDYQQAVDHKTQCLVSFAAMGIYEANNL